MRHPCIIPRDIFGPTPTIKSISEGSQTSTLMVNDYTKPTHVIRSSPRYLCHRARSDRLSLDTLRLPHSLPTGPASVKRNNNKHCTSEVINLSTKQRRWPILLRYGAYWLYGSYTHAEDDAAGWQTSRSISPSGQQESGARGCVTKPSPNRDGGGTPPIDIPPIFRFYCGTCENHILFITNVS